MNKGFASICVLLTMFVIIFNRPNTSWANAERTANTFALSMPGTWTVVSSPTTEYLRSVSMVSATDGWAVGNNGVILHWDGNAWVQIAGSTTFTDELDSVSAISANDAWAVGLSDRIIRWDGSTWTPVTLPHSYTSALGVSAIDSNNAWVIEGYAVCNQSGCTDYGYIHRWNGSAWETTGNTSDEPISIDMVSATEGWVVGTKLIPQNPSQSIIKHWDGSTWANVAHPNINTAWDVSALNTSDAWVIGGYSGSTLHWDGSQWSQVTNPVTSALYGIDMVANSDVWAVGANGTIIHWDGSTWTQIDSPVTVSLTGIDMVSVNEGWAVGQDGTILHYYVPPVLNINYNMGEPGSFFTLTGTYFLTSSTATITVNGHEIGTTPTDSSGNLEFILDTSQADNGRYSVVASVNPSASASFIIDPTAPLRLQEGSGPILNVPSGIAFTNIIFLPLVMNNYSNIKTETFYSQSQDGEIINHNCNDWETCRASSQGTLSFSTYQNGTVSATFVDLKYYLNRVYLFFDTSSIPANAQIQSATLHIYAGQFQHGGTTFHVVLSTAGIPLTTSDFGQVQFISGGSATPTANSWANVTLNASAVEWITKSGTTKLALIHDFDLNNTAPGENNDLLVALAENSSYRPYLDVTYSLP